MKRILYIALFEIFEIVDGMSIPVTICNDTTQPVIVKNFDLKRSSVNIYSARKVSANSSISFSIIPIVGPGNESFTVTVGRCNIKIWWNLVPKKGIGPFVEQISEDYRIVKKLNSFGEVSFHVLRRDQLKKEAQELKQQHLDLQDLIEQTGFKEVELRAI